MKQYLCIVSMKKLCLYFLMVLFRELRNRIKIILPFLVFFLVRKQLSLKGKDVTWHVILLVQFILSRSFPAFALGVIIFSTEDLRQQGGKQTCWIHKCNSD